MCGWHMSEWRRNVPYLAQQSEHDFSLLSNRTQCTPKCQLTAENCIQYTCSVCVCVCELIFNSVILISRSSEITTRNEWQDAFSFSAPFSQLQAVAPVGCLVSTSAESKCPNARDGSGCMCCDVHVRSSAHTTSAGRTMICNIFSIFHHHATAGQCAIISKTKTPTRTMRP